MRRTVMMASAAVAAVMGWVSAAAPARAAAVSGPRETVDFSFSSVLPNAPTGYRYVEWFYNPGHAPGPAPVVRELTYVPPAGSRFDTRAAPECLATDDELKSKGEAACPPGSRTGTGRTTVALVGFGRLDGVMRLLNAPNQQIDAALFGGRVGGVVRNRYAGGMFRARLQTCFAGGQAPEDCPADQVAVVFTDQSVPALVSGRGAARRSLATNPPTCPRTGAWISRFSYRFADGTTDRIVIRHPCTRPALKVRRRGCALRARVTGRDLREVSAVTFYVNGRRVARDRRAPFRLRRHLRAGRRHRVGAVLRAHGAPVVKMRRRVGPC